MLFSVIYTDREQTPEPRKKLIDLGRSIVMRYCRRCLLLPLLLLLAFPRQITAKPPGFTTENVSFQSAGVTLVGTLFKPGQPVAAVVLVHGSGQEKRMTEFAALLASNGLAVFTYDKRGVGESGGVYAGPEVGTNNIDAANLTLLAADASAAVNVLSAHLPAKQGPIGLLGFSQAGWIIPLAATKNRTVRFLVLFSGPVITAREQLRFQFFTEGKANFWATHTEAEAREHLRNDPDRYQFADTDARNALTTLSTPGLWLFGGQDVQVPVRLSMEHLDALKTQGKPYEYRLFPALGHNTSGSDSSEPVDAAIEWIKATSGRPKRKSK